MNYLIKDVTLVYGVEHATPTEKVSILIKPPYIDKIFKTNNIPSSDLPNNLKIIDGSKLHAFPGIIDDQVHFREPGLTHKADIYTEAKAAVAGGITSFMEMPNTIPQTTSILELDKKFDIAKQKSLANYSFYLGATNNNLDELKKIDSSKTCGVKIFMGSSTGNMLVNNEKALEAIFDTVKIIITTHCEDEATIQKNTQLFIKKYGGDIPMDAHPLIRSEEACYLSSKKAFHLAEKYKSNLHILHISTKKELDLFQKAQIEKKHITAECCVHHLLFSDKDYKKKGAFIKWNPAIKREEDRLALIEAVKNNQIDIIATDHSPHTLEEKKKPYLKCASGGPMVQHAFLVMLEFYHKGIFSLPLLVEKMCYNPTKRFQISKRGYVQEGFFADIVLVNLNKSQKIISDSLLYKCGWSPVEGETFHSTIEHTFINGHLAYSEGNFDESKMGEALYFNRKY